MAFKIQTGFVCLTVFIPLTVSVPGRAAAPPYKSVKVLIPNDQPPSGQLVQAPFYKPHETASPLSRDASQQAVKAWVTSNERTGCAGITLFDPATDKPITNLIIDEPGVAYSSGEESTGPPCAAGSTLLPPTNSAAVVQFPDDERVNPQVCLPVALPPGASVPSLGKTPVKGFDATHICAPLATESHARHPHGITIDTTRKIAYQVIEHSGLRWNSARTAFEVALTTDEESGLLVAYDVSTLSAPKVVNGWLLGHASEEAAVNVKNGKIFIGNHEDSPGVYPNIWVTVIDPALANPYGFIDTGYYNAVQGVFVDQGLNLVFGTTHVGEKMFAFDAGCVPQTNGAGVVPPPPPPGFTLPADTNMSSGWNCIQYWVDLRPAFVSTFPNVAAALLTPGVILHMHDLTADPSRHRVYQSLHSIHDAEHTGLPEREPPPGQEKGIDSEEIEVHGNARWVVEVDAGGSFPINPAKQAFAPVYVIDMSHGYDVLSYPSSEDILQNEGLAKLENSFVHAHFLAVDPANSTLFVTGEHTGNIGIVDIDRRQLRQVLPISIAIPGCGGLKPTPIGTEPAEPHVHGVSVTSPGVTYVSDEGESCYYESVTILNIGN